jgi:hypothetical protein
MTLYGLFFQSVKVNPNAGEDAGKIITTNLYLI